MLALTGGARTVEAPPPHTHPVDFSPADRQAVLDFIDGPGSTTSYYGREGILRDFEDELAAYHSRRWCVLTNSGTNALHSAYFGIGIEPGDEVLAPTYTFLATVTPLLQLGAIPVLVDCEPDTGNIAPEDLEHRITDRTRAITVTHQWGHPVDMDAVMDVARLHGLAIVEDVSLAVGATYHGRRTATFGDVAAFSLGSTKMISGGQGGALVTDDREIMERANLVGHFVRRSADQVESSRYRPFCDTGYGHNYRMHVLAIAIARARFHNIAEMIAARHERLTALSAHLAGSRSLAPPVTRDHVTRGTWVGFSASFDADAAGVSLEAYCAALAAEGLEVLGGGYHAPLHRAAFFQTRDDGFYKRREYAPGKRIYREGDFPVAEAHADRQVAFPLFLDEPLELVEAYGAAVRKVDAHLDELREWERRERLEPV